MNDHKRLAQLSDAAYGTPTIRDAGTDTEVLIEGDVVAFRGTSSWRDWVTDAKAVYVPWVTPTGMKGFVHGGFFRAFSSVRERITERVKQMSAVTFTGHSLGGALATLAAAWYCGAQRKIGRLITFGSPKVGNDEFADNFDDIPTSIYRHGRDAVTYVPNLLWPRLSDTIGNGELDGPLATVHVDEVKVIGSTWRKLWFMPLWPKPPTPLDHPLAHYIEAL